MKTKASLLGLVFGLLTFINSGNAGLSRYLEIPEVDGGSVAKGHGRAILATGYEFSVDAAGVTSFIVHKLNDKATATLLLAQLAGTTYPSAKFTVEKGTKQQYLTMDFTNVVITSFTEIDHGGGSGDTPVESISINFSKVTIVYSEQEPGGIVAPSPPVTIINGPPPNCGE